MTGRLLGLAILGLTALGPVAGPARAELWGLVIGIDDYQHIPKLKGAVNDARDMERALKTMGAREITVLLDAQASRDAILAAWRAIVRRAKPGDTLIVSYAGHGGQEPERVRGSEEDGQDEVLLLAGFDPSGPASYERIPDDDLNELLRESADLVVLFVSDACHSGTMTRAFDPRAGEASVRFYDYGSISGDALPPPSPTTARTRDTELTHVTYFAGVTDDKTVPEVTIDGEQRGAMSWSVAAALRGAGDADGDGAITVGELQGYVLENVRMKTRGRQQPVVTAPKGEKTTLLKLTAAAAPVGGAQGPALSPLPMVTLHLTNAAGLDTAALGRQLQRVRLVEAAEGAELVWDVARGDLVLDTGDLVQTRAFRRRGQGEARVAPGDLDLVRLQQAIDKWALSKAVAAASASRSLTLRMNPDERRYKAGETPTFTVSGQSYPHFTLVNVAADGSIHFLYPVRQYNDSPTIALDRPFELPLEVSPPLGADHFIAIASETLLAGLHRELEGLEGAPAADRLAALLATHLRGQRHQLGIHAVFTGE